jgi:hypothetical protein
MLDVQDTSDTEKTGEEVSEGGGGSCESRCRTGKSVRVVAQGACESWVVWAGRLWMRYGISEQKNYLPYSRCLSRRRRSRAHVPMSIAGGHAHNSEVANIGDTCLRKRIEER